MIHRTLMAIVSVSAIWCASCHESIESSKPIQDNSVPLPTAQDWPSIEMLDKIRSLFAYAVPPSDWPEDVKSALSDEALREKIELQLGNFEDGEAHRCAIAYVLALTSEDTKPYVDIMLEAVKRHHEGFRAMTYEESAVEALPEALHVLWLETSSKPALHALVTLDFEGAPGETLSVVRLSLLREHGEQLMRAVFEVTDGDFEKATTRDPLTLLSDIRFRMSARFRDPDDYIEELQALALLQKNAKGRDDKFSRFVRKAVEYALKPWSDE